MHAAPRILIVDDVIENVAVLGETLSDAFEIDKDGFLVPRTD